MSGAGIFSAVFAVAKIEASEIPVDFEIYFAAEARAVIFIIHLPTPE
jgi:hypothetical protein